jgi:hypothetical protein
MFARFCVVFSFAHEYMVKHMYLNWGGLAQLKQEIMALPNSAYAGFNDDETPDEYARFDDDETPGGPGYIGVMINSGPNVSDEFEFSIEALDKYASRTPGFSTREYLYGGTGPDIERTDPTMINIVQELGSRRASNDGCWIVIKLVPWDLRNHFSIEYDFDDYSEFIDFQVKTLRRTRN